MLILPCIQYGRAFIYLFIFKAAQAASVVFPFWVFFCSYLSFYWPNLPMVMGHRHQKLEITPRDATSIPCPLFRPPLPLPLPAQPETLAVIFCLPLGRFFTHRKGEINSIFPWNKNKWIPACYNIEPWAESRALILITPCFKTVGQSPFFSCTVERLKRFSQILQS